MGIKFPKLKTKRSKIFFAILLVIFVASCATTTTLLLLSRIDYKLADGPTYEVNTENTVATLFSQVNSGTIENSDTLLETAKIGEKTQEVTIISKLGTKSSINVSYIVTDTISPIVKGDDELTFEAGSEIDILSHYQAEDNSKQEVALSIDGEYNLDEPGDYEIQIFAQDESGNKSNKKVNLKITEPPRQVSTTSTSTPYYVKVNRQQNVVIVYSKDQNGNYTKIEKVFIGSTGAPDSETPLGTFTVTDRFEALYLVGEVWGHYAVRIEGPYFFHSVPYFTKGTPYWDNLEYLEYNKLGNGASAGCVRLAAIDAKWIYDNIGYGTTVEIYDSDTLPSGVVKPSAIKIDENSPNRGWDPTDPDPENPWN